MHRFGRVAVAGVLCGSAALGVATVAQASPGKGPGHQKAFNGNAHLIHVGLNPATCGTVPGTKSGEVNLHSNATRNRSRVNVSVHGAMPNTTYVVDIRCVAQIGTLKTNRAGNGTAHIKISAPLPTGLPMYVDISVPGGGGGTGGYGDTFIAGPFNLGAKK